MEGVQCKVPKARDKTLLIGVVILSAHRRLDLYVICEDYKDFFCQKMRSMNQVLNF